MAQKIKKYWFRFFATFVALYLAPLSNWVAHIFGHDAAAYAVTFTCRSTGGSGGTDQAILHCGGGYNSSNKTYTLTNAQTTFDTGVKVTCACPSDITKVIVYSCYAPDQSLPMWEAADSCTTFSGTLAACKTNQIRVAGFCTNYCEANANGGVVLKPGSLQTYVMQNP